MYMLIIFISVIVLNCSFNKTSYKVQDCEAGAGHEISLKKLSILHKPTKWWVTEQLEVCLVCIYACCTG